MKRCIIALNVIFLICSVNIPDVSAKQAFTDSIFKETFEKGRVFVFVKILSVHSETIYNSTTKETGSEKMVLTRPGKNYYYKTKLIRMVVPGDFTEQDLKEPLELSAGVAYRKTLKADSTYALFIFKKAPYDFSWAHRKNVLNISCWKKKDLLALEKTAKLAYQKSLISQFRSTQFTGKPSLPELPQKIISACELFRTHPENRIKSAYLISDSKLGSQHDSSLPFPTAIPTLPPEKPLKREQAFFLLGEPTMKSGRFYYWLCGEIKDKSLPVEFVGLIKIIFDENETVIRLFYTADEKKNWLP